MQGLEPPLVDPNFSKTLLEIALFQLDLDPTSSPTGVTELARVGSHAEEDTFLFSRCPCRQQARVVDECARFTEGDSFKDLLVP